MATVSSAAAAANLAPSTDICFLCALKIHQCGRLISDRGGGAGAISVGAALLIMNASTLFFGSLAVYLSYVLPGEYGVKRSPLFPCRRCFAHYQKYRMASTTGVAETSSASLLASPSTQPDHTESLDGHSLSLASETDGVITDMEAPVAEAVQESAGQPKVVLAHLRKVYEGKKETVAVKNMNLRLYEGQILSLLGHNGKSGSHQ